MHGITVRISEEPLVNAIHRRLAEIAFAIYATGLAYICVVPFDFTWHKVIDPAPTRFLRLLMTGAGLPDIFANIAIYMPFGAVAYVVLRRLNRGRWVSGGLTVLLAGLFSFGIEQAQYFVQSRVCAWSDVLSNSLGAWLGMMGFGIWHGEFRRVVEKGREAARRNWWLAVSKGAVCLMLIAHLRPYDVVVDIRHTAAETVRHADVGPFAAWHGLRAKVATQVNLGRRDGMHELARVRWEYALDRVVDTAGYAGLSILLAMGLARDFRRRRRLYGWIGFVVVSLAMMVTTIRIFLISHGLDTAHLGCGVLGWLIGCAVAHGIRGGLPNPPAERIDRPGPRAIPPGLQGAAIAVALILVVLYELVPFDFATGPGADSALRGSFCMTPFQWHFLSRPNDALDDVSGELLRYGVMGVGLALLFRRWGRWSWRTELAACVILTGIVCSAFEAVHLTMATRRTDITTLMLALFASFAGCIAVRWVFDYRAYLSLHVVDDPLTRQLIEGETYDKAGLTPPGSGQGDASRRDRARSR
ncbi:MAG: VanZ family protein [Phycisphaerae bacterium]